MNNNEAEEQVKAFITLLKKEYDVSVEEIVEAVKYQRRINKYGETIAKTVIGSVTLGLMYAIYYGLIQIFSKGAN